jgi:acetolactate synthase-1/2/3 large subunit
MNMQGCRPACSTLADKIVNLNNAALGMVKQWQDMQYGGRHSHSTYRDALPDFIRLVEAFGHVGLRVDRVGDLAPAMKEAFGEKNRKRLVFLDIHVDPDEHVYPMSIKGGSLRDMFLSKGETS